MANTPEAPPAEQHDRHEASRFNLRAYVWFLIVFVLVAAVLHVIVWLVYGALVRGAPPTLVSPLARQAPQPAEPRLQGSRAHPYTPAEDLRLMLAREQDILGSYEWIDRDAGLARIPIERAMELIVQQASESE